VHGLPRDRGKKPSDPHNDQALQDRKPAQLILAASNCSEKDMFDRRSPSTWRGALALCCLSLASGGARCEELPGTMPLIAQGDLAAQMVAGIDKYLMRELKAAESGGADKWNVDTASPEKYRQSIKSNRERLRKLLGVIDTRFSPVVMEFASASKESLLVAETSAYKIYQVRWPVFPGVDGEGLLVEPKGPVRASIVAIPDADQTPETLLGIDGKLPAKLHFVIRLADSGCRMVIPVLIDRQCGLSANPRLGRETNLSHREFIWRMAYEMGRHILGYEIQKTLAAVDWLKSQNERLPVGMYGYGEGGLVALYAGAIDPRIESTVVCGVGTRERSQVWKEPIDRSIWASLPEFRDDLAGVLYGPDRHLIYEESYGPQVPGPPAHKNHREAAPGRLETPDALRKVFESQTDSASVRVAISPPGTTHGDFFRRTVCAPQGMSGHESVVADFLKSLKVAQVSPAVPPARDMRQDFDPAARHNRQFDQLVAFTQRLWRTSEDVRRDFWEKADSSSIDKWEQSTEWYRNYFWDEVIGKLPKQTEPLNPRSRLLYDTPKWKGFEVVLDLYPDVFAYGILLLPKDLKPGEKRPVVVCQHGLEGRPQDVCNPEKRTPYYNSFGAQLADMGYIVYAPQNPYIGGDKFRILLRKGHPLKLSLYSFIVRQHETTTNWLASLPFVEGDHIAFYGLSYGGKTAMRIPAIVKRYCLSICSGDFNEWIGKNVSIDFRGSYMWSNEYDMYEFDLGHTYNYAEMARLIAPRPFMVERGHDDGVGVDEMIAYEYAKVRYLYANKLKIPERTAIEFFPGGHEIHLKGTAEFLKRHLGWPN
jgi:dienelactone hydrolase